MAVGGVGGGLGDCSVALFDMDRTLVRVDTATLYVRHQHRIGEATVLDVARVAWWMVQYTLGVIDAERVAAQVAAGYAGRSEAALIDQCEGWFRSDVVRHVSDAARRTVDAYRSAGVPTAIVTGGTRYAADPLAAELGIDHVVCTRLEVEAGAFTGRVLSPMCFGRGKIALANDCAAHAGFSLDSAHFFTDSITDLPLLEHVARPVVVNPDGRLRRIARRRGWPIESW